jgi:hypothetical protein
MTSNLLRLSQRLAQCALAAALVAAPAAARADGIPPGGQDPTRAVALPKVPGAPVVIDTAYVDILSGANGEHDDVNSSCIRYRNVATDTIVEIRFQRTFFDEARARIGEDSVETHTTRKPNPHDLPGTGPLANAYWACTHGKNPYGPKMQTVTIQPVYVKFTSGKTWQLR